MREKVLADKLRQHQMAIKQQQREADQQRYVLRGSIGSSGSDFDGGDIEGSIFGAGGQAACCGGVDVEPGSGRVSCGGPLRDGVCGGMGRGHAAPMAAAPMELKARRGASHEAVSGTRMVSCGCSNRRLERTLERLEHVPAEAGTAQPGCHCRVGMTNGSASRLSGSGSYGSGSCGGVASGVGSAGRRMTDSSSLPPVRPPNERALPRPRPASGVATEARQAPQKREGHHRILVAALEAGRRHTR